MREIIFREGYKLFHSKRQCFLIIVLLGITPLMFSASVGWKHEMVYVLLDETEEEREFFTSDGWIYQDIVDLIGKGYAEHNLGEPSLLYMKPEAFALFREGGELHEKYKEYHFPERMVLQQFLGGDIAPPEQEDFEATWRFHKMLTDASAASYVAIIFTAFFFGLDFTRRGYQGALFGGQRRGGLFWGKYLVFFLSFFLLSFAELGLAIIIFIPKIELLPASYLLKGLFLRSLCDTGIALLGVTFVFLLKSEWKAIGVTFLVMILFRSYAAILYLDPYQFISKDYWKTCSEIGTTIQVGVVTAIIFVISGLLSAGLFQRAELK